MPGWADIRRPFREALTAAYDWHKLETVLREHCDRRLHLITSDTIGFSQNVADVIDDAEHSCWLECLARGVLAGNPLHPDLQATVPKILAGIEAEGSAYYKQPPPGPAKQYFEPDMVLIPEGEFWMGSDHAPDEKPLHKVELPDFWIGKYPVTNKQFHEFIKSSQQLATPEMSWDGNKPYRETKEHPVAGVTWNQAMAYCEWLRSTTRRAYWLPTEAQWEKAARGTEACLYPWGNEWEDDRCNRGDVITPVKLYGVQSVYGCCDMVGNTYEWTLTIWGRKAWKRDEGYAYEWDEDGRNDPDDLPNMRRVIRGGRHALPIEYRCSFCDSCRTDKSGPGSNPIGFRVVIRLDS